MHQNYELYQSAGTKTGDIFERRSHIGINKVQPKYNGPFPVYHIRIAVV
jgi:hypothetical protein